MEGLKPSEALKQIIVTDSFKATNPQKSKFTRLGEEDDFSGKKKIYANVTTNDESLKFNFKRFEKYKKDLGEPDDNNAHNRGEVWKDININQFNIFLNELKVNNEVSRQFYPQQFANYIKNWHQGGVGDLPIINIAHMKNKDTKKFDLRQRDLSIDTPQNLEDVKENCKDVLKPFIGGKGTNYISDYFIDQDKEFHLKNKNPQREFEQGILFIFYYLNPNYIGKFKFLNSSEKTLCFFNKGDEKYRNEKYPMLNYAVICPKGGPSSQTVVNKTL